MKRQGMTSKNVLWLVVGIWLAGAACQDTRPTAPEATGVVVLPGSPSNALTWPDAGSCVIGFKDGTFLGSPVPTTDYACGVKWTLYYPPLNGRPREWSFVWRDSTKFTTSAYEDLQNGPLEVSFSVPVSDVKVELSLINLPGHYMTAHDANGNEIARETFASSGTDTKILAVQGIRKIRIYPLLGEPDVYGDYPKLDNVYHRISFELGPQRLNVACTSPVTRGGTVRCTTTLQNPAPYTVVLKRAAVKGYTVTDNTRVPHSQGSSDIWEGLAVASGDVTVVAEVVEQGVTKTYTNATSAAFTIQARAWPVWQLTTPFEQVVLTRRILDYPTDSSAWGQFQVEWPQGDSALVPVSRATGGPNRGLAILRDPIVVNTFVVGISPALFKPGTPGVPQYPRSVAWYNDQNGKPSGTCRANDVSKLLANVRRHEGIGIASNSHAGVANQQFAQLRPDTLFERLYTDQPNRVVWDSVNTIVVNFADSGGAYFAGQRAFDSPAEMQLVNTGGMKCNFDYDLSNQ